MQKQEAITILENTFNNAFDENNFTLFVKNLLNDLDTTKYNHYSGNYIKDAFRKHIKQYKRIGKYTDPNGDAMDVLLVEVTDQYHLDHARSSLRNFVITHLDNFEKDYALVAFFSESDARADWRFSFVKLEYKTEVKDGKVKQNKELTPAKRYSFLVGEHERAHTAKKQLLPLLENIYNNPTIEELEGAFSIETVTDEFFEQYKALFVCLTEQFGQNHQLKTELAASGIEIPRFTKKLLGQIVFLYFLQKKGWMGVAKDQKWGKGEKRFLQKLYDEAIESGKNFFGDFLQILFYEALAHKHTDEGVHGYFAKLKCKVPFLNGGLFEADYDWENDHITIPNELFRNKDKMGKSGDIGSGVLDVFDRYNFTIKEDEPLEKEVAVDPEMLGKVFENMLEITERKSKGAFYTPREIVHYMCQESLIHYLDNAVNTYSKTYQELGNPQISMFGNEVNKGQQSLILEQDHILIQKEDIETFIRKGFFTLENDQRILKKGNETRTYQFKLPESIRINADLLNTKLAEIRICDPAIGSGAFPVGMLHEIVNARLVLRHHLKNQDKPINPESPESDKYAYQLKRHTIQECIYGVDIDPSAIDIARLRLWLSLVVDEEDLDTIEALPNLDYKIVCGNSLIGLPATAMRDLIVENELEELKDEFFKETDENDKKVLRIRINNKIRQLLDSAEQFAGYKIDFDFKLFFSEVWHEKDGFDVVVGNPPYVSAWEMTKNEPTYRDLIKLVLKDFKDVLTGHWDLFIPFLLKGHILNNPEGSTTFILPNPILREKYAIPLRKFLLEKTNLLSILHFDESNVFKKVSRKAAVLFISRNQKRKINIYRNSTWGLFNTEIYLDKVVDKSTFLRNDGYKFTIDTDFSSQKFLSLIDLKSIPLGMIFYVNYGAQVSSKVSGQFKKSDVISKEPIGNSKRFIEGKDVSRWKLKYRNLWLDYRKSEMYGPRSESIFENTKLVFRKVSDKGHKLALAIDYLHFYTDDGCVLALPYEEVPDLQQSFSGIDRIYQKSFSVEYVLGALLNDVLNYYFRNKFATESLQGATSHTYPQSVRMLPILNCGFGEYELEMLTKYIIQISGIDSVMNYSLSTGFFKEVQNSLVFELYFPNEIQLAGKGILKHLGDLKPITDDMNDEQKLSIIQSEFERLYDPNHPVRNNVETLDSVEEVRIIKEALK